MCFVAHRIVFFVFCMGAFLNRAYLCMFFLNPVFRFSWSGPLQLRKNLLAARWFRSGSGFRSGTGSGAGPK